MKRTFESFVRALECSFDLPRDVISDFKAAVGHPDVRFRDQGRDVNGHSIAILSCSRGLAVFSISFCVIDTMTVVDAQAERQVFNIAPNDWELVPEEWR